MAVPGGDYSVGLPDLARGGRVANEVNWKPALLLLLATGVWPGVANLENIFGTK